MSQTQIRLIVGLGNPGSQYEKTRHNIGFDFVDQLATDFRGSFQLETGFFALVTKCLYQGRPLYMMKPTTYMNRSGQAVRAFAQFYKIAVEEILVLHDELDLSVGQLKLKQGGGHAGHNGLRDIQAQMGSPDFWRLRIGVGHPRELGLAQSVADYVLHRPRQEDVPLLDDALHRSQIAITHFLDGDKNKAMRALVKDAS